MATGSSLIHVLKRAAATISTSLLSKLAPTLLSKLAPTAASFNGGSDTSRRMFNGGSDDQHDKDGMYVCFENPKLKKKLHAAFVSVEQNTVSVKEKSSGREIERILINHDFHGLNGAKGEMENGMLKLWLPLPGLLTRQNGEQKNHDDQAGITTHECEGGCHAQVKMHPGMENDHYKLWVVQNKMIIKEQRSEGESASAIADLPPKLHSLNGAEGEMKYGVLSLWLPKKAEL